MHLCPPIAALAAAFGLCLAGGAQAACPSPVTAQYKKVTHTTPVVNGLHVDQYSWYDSKCLPRTVALKQEGGGNPGHGGYVAQITYQVAAGGGTTTVTANADTTPDGGFGYFVSHERYRSFTDGSSDTIAGKIFHTDDSPLGRDFAVTGSALTPTATAAAQRFTTTYHHYGTITPIPKDADGNDVMPTPITPASFKLYPMPVTLTWVFQALTDAPRIDVVVDLSGIGAPDLANFDLRAPYGVLVFDNGADATVTKVMWGDRFHFVTTASPVTRNSGWTWNVANAGGRYSALIAGAYEMGLYEPRKFSASALDDGYADERGNTSTGYNHGKGCEGETQIIPCDWEWPYQSLQYSLPYASASDPNANNQPTNFKKMAWGSTAFYGTGTSLPKVFDSPTTSEAFVGWPTNEKIAYSICVLLGKTTTAGLTKTAAGRAKPSCASAAFP